MADLVPLAPNPDRRISVVAELQVAHGDLGGLIRARARVVEEQKHGVVSTTLCRALVGRSQQGVDLWFLKIGHRLLAITRK